MLPSEHFLLTDHQTLRRQCWINAFTAYLQLGMSQTDAGIEADLALQEFETRWSESKKAIMPGNN